MSETRATPFARALLWISIAGVPLVFWRLPHDPFDTPKLSLLLCVTAVVAIIALLDRWRPPAGLWIPVAALWIPLALAWLATPYKGWSLMGEYSRYQGLVPGTAFAVWTILVACAFRGRARQLTMAIAVAGTGVALYAVVQLFGLDPFEWSESAFVASTVGHSNFAGAVLAMTLPVVLAMWMEPSSWTGVGRAATILVTVALIGTFSQGAWVAAGAGCAVMIGCVAGNKRRWTVLGGLVIATALAIVNVGVVILSQLDPYGALGGTSIWTRGLSWSTAVAIGSDHPLIGAGPNAFAYLSSAYRSPVEALVTGRADDPHSVPLALFADHGALAVIGFGLLVAWVVMRTRMLPSNPLAAGFAGGSIAYLVVSLVTVNEVALRSVFWACIAGLAIVTASSEPSSLGWLPGRGVKRRLLSSGALGASLVGALCLFVLGVGLIVADVGVARSLQVVSRDLEEAEQRFGLVAGTPGSNYHQYQFYGRALADTAVNAESEATDYWDAAESTYLRIIGFPYVRYVGPSADALTQRSAFDDSYIDEALARWRRMQSLDPYDPHVAVEIATLLVRKGEVNAALDVLGPFERRLKGTLPRGASRAPEVWGTLAIAQLYVGDGKAAVDAFRIGVAIDPRSCRILVARRLLEEAGEELTWLPPASDAAQDLQARLACAPGALVLLGPVESS